MRILLVSLITGIVFCCCCAAARVKGSQGIEGKVYRVSGNQMPSPDVQKPAPKPVKTTLYIYELTNISQVVRPDEGAFYSNIATKLVKEVTTDDNGAFTVALPAGSYSVFTKKGSLYYANIFDEKNNIAPVIVKAGKMTRIEVKIDYDAVY